MRSSRKPETPLFPRQIKPWLGVLLVMVVLGGVIGAYVLYSGTIKIAATNQHGPILHYVFQTGRMQSISRHSKTVPDWPVALEGLSDDAMQLRGAGHYASMCVECHGAPGVVQPAYTDAMLPKPPRLDRIVTEREPRELYWVVRNGIMMSGMPAWPEPVRPDEVWAVVKFIQALPDMTPETYQKLSDQSGQAPFGTGGSRLTEAPVQPVIAPPGIGTGTVARCAACHGYDGLGGEAGAIPALGLLDEDYLYASLKAYQSGDRISGIMHAQAVALSDEEMQGLAKYYARQPAPQQPDVDLPRTLIDRGRQLAEAGADDVAACTNCHAYEGDSYVPPYPAINAQHYPYIVSQLMAWKFNERGYALGKDVVDAMGPLSHELEPDQIRAVAAYFATAKPLSKTDGSQDEGMDGTQDGDTDSRSRDGE